MAKKNETSSIYDIVKGLSQAAANAYDGALTEEGEPVAIGLQREEGHLILDTRVIDGFNVVFYGNMMCLTYQSDVKLKEVYSNGIRKKTEIDQRLTDIASWLKKEYRKITGKSIALTEEGEVDVMVQSTSHVRSWVQAKKHYKVGGLSEEMEIEAPSKERLEKSWKTFLLTSGDGKESAPRTTLDRRTVESKHGSVAPGSLSHYS